MTILQALILGIIQGLTEFLPISSSAHLVITPFILGWEIPAEQVFPFDVLVQLGTLLAVILYFHKDLWGIIDSFFSGLIHLKPFEDPQSRLGWYLILATIPAGIVALLIKDQVDAAFHDPSITAAFLFVTAGFLFLAEYLGKRSRDFIEITWKDALWIGIAQTISLFPGVSRSGSTIAGGLLRGLQRTSAGRFSFLMAVPIMLAAGLLSILDLLKVPDLAAFLPSLITGIVAATIIGYVSIHWFLTFINKHSLKWFALYCIIIGTITIVIYYVR